MSLSNVEKYSPNSIESNNRSKQGTRTESKGFYFFIEVIMKTTEKFVKLEDVKEMIERYINQYRQNSILLSEISLAMSSLQQYSNNHEWRLQETWISVDERLPDWDEEYIVYDVNDQVVTCATFSTDTDKFDITFWMVTHWMELPEPPKENSLPPNSK